MKHWITDPEVDPAEFERKKLEIEVMLDEYEEAILAAASWYSTWKQKRPKGFRAVRRRSA